MTKMTFLLTIIRGKPSILENLMLGPKSMAGVQKPQFIFLVW